MFLLLSFLSSQRMNGNSKAKWKRLLIWRWCYRTCIDAILISRTTFLGAHHLYFIQCLDSCYRNVSFRKSKFFSLFYFLFLVKSCHCHFTALWSFSANIFTFSESVLNNLYHSADSKIPLLR